MKDYSGLVKKARSAKQYSYSPYSKFRVGAALLSTSGKIYMGCNIENSSFGLTICAERTALFKAISEGTRKFKALAIASDAKGFIPPCGACRQVILDLARDVDVIMTDSRGKTKILKAIELLPYPFDTHYLIKPK